MSLINGINTILAFFENGQWYPYACARSSTVQVDVETIETSVSGSGTWQTNMPTKRKFSGNFEGLVALSNVAVLSAADLTARMIAGTEMLFRHQVVAQDGSVYTEQGYIYFTGRPLTSSFDNVVTFSMNFIGNGELTQVFTPIVQPTPIMYRFEYTASGGESGFSDAALINKDIQHVSKDGIENAKIVTGAPGSKEVRYNAAGGQFTWAVEFEPGEIAVINYQNL